jgi:outer membrane protein
MTGTPGTKRAASAALFSGLFHGAAGTIRKPGLRVRFPETDCMQPCPPRRPRTTVRHVLLLLAAISAAPLVTAATLGEILDLARRSDPIHAAAVAAEAAGREKQVQGRAGLLPTVNVAGNVRQNQEQGSSAGGTRNYHSGAIALTLNQPLFRRANVVASEQGELQAVLAQLQLKAAEQDLLLRVARGYFEVLQAQDALQSLGAQREAFAQQLTQARRSFDAGMAPVTDVSEAQARHDLTVAQAITARNELELKRRAMERLIDRELPPLSALDDSATLELMTSRAMSDLVDRAPVQSLQVTIAQVQVDVAQRELGRQDSGHLPTADLVASVGETRNANYGTLGANSLRQASVGIEVTLPVYQGGAVSSRAREASANLERARHDLENARRLARQEARQAMLGAVNGAALQRALREAVASSETQARATRRGLEVGMRTRVDVLNAEQQVHAARRDLAAARYQTVLASLQLKAAAGVLGEADVRGLDRLLK